MGSPIMERSIRLLLFLGCGFSTTQQPNLCQKSLIFAAASFPPRRASCRGEPRRCRDPHAGSLHGDGWGDLVRKARRGEEQLAVGVKGGVMPAVLTPQIDPKSMSHQPNRGRDPWVTPGITKRPPRDCRHHTETPRDPRHHSKTLRDPGHCTETPGWPLASHRDPKGPRALHSHLEELSPWPGQDLALAPAPVQDAAEG